MSVNPSDFLRAFVLSVTERLQRGESVGLPGVGTWTAARDETSGRVVVRFSDEAEPAGQVDPALALAIALEVGSAQPEITARLSGYARAIESHLAETGSVLIPGIGRLSGSPGQVSFRPESLFAEAVDWDRPGTSPLPDVDESPAESLPRWDDGPRPAGTPPPSVEPGGSDDDDTERTTAVPDGPDDLEETAPVPRVPPPVEPVSDRPPPEPSPPEGATEPARAAVRSRRPARRATAPENRSFNPIVPLVIAAVVVVAATVAVLLLRGSDGTPEPEPVAVADTLGEAAPGGMPGESAPAETLTTAAIDPPVADSAAPAPSAPTGTPEPERPDLTLEQSFDITAEGYTLIVGSTTSETEALASIARYEPLDLPTAVLAYPEDGSVRFRLAVGRYATVDDAVRALEDLSERLPAGSWVRRIRP